MKNRDLAKILLENPDGDVEASVDIATGVLDANGEEVIAKVFGMSIIDAIVFNPNGPKSTDSKGSMVTLHFEEAGTTIDHVAVDTIEAIKKAQLERVAAIKKAKEAE